MQPKSNSLFHFTKTIENLKGILDNGFYPRYSLEDATVLGHEYMGYPMVCFCDIPISRIIEHTSFYGEYGIGMTKEWGLKNKLSPLLYSPAGGVIPSFANFVRGLREVTDADSPDYLELRSNLNIHVYDILPMIKPLSGKMIVGGSPIEKNFTQESEWRYVPFHAKILYKDGFDKEVEACNIELESSCLEFNSLDIKYIFVKSDAEIPFLFDFIQAHLARFPLNDIKILISRITSLETISKDL